MTLSNTEERRQAGISINGNIDDFLELAEKGKRAVAVVVGGYPPMDP